MKKIIGIVSSLAAISGICAAVLAAIAAITREPIAEMKAKREQAAVMAVMPAGVVAVEKLGECFAGKDAGGKVAGYAAKGSDAGGYGGDIVLMVGFEADGDTLVCYRTLAAAETPGLGMKLNSPEFADQFRGQPAASVALANDGGKIRPITSATITSRAVVKAVADARRRLSAAR